MMVLSSAHLPLLLSYSTTMTTLAFQNPLSPQQRGGLAYSSSLTRTKPLPYLPEAIEEETALAVLDKILHPNRHTNKKNNKAAPIPPHDQQQEHQRLGDQNPNVSNKADDTPLPFGGRIEEAFASAKARGEAAFISYVTAGYPTLDDTPDILLRMQEGGASLIELGVPFTDPQADGRTIQKAHQVALERGTFTIRQCLEALQKARARGLTIPVVLMGYYNPFLQYGSADQLCRDAAEAGADGFLVVDLPFDDDTFGQDFGRACLRHGLSNIPLVAPTSTNERIRELAETTATTFLYCVSVAGVTGARDTLPPDLEDFVARVRAQTDLPLAVGFGISNPAMVQSVSDIADGVVVGSAILKALDNGEEEQGQESPQGAAKYAPLFQAEPKFRAVRDTVAHLATGLRQSPFAKNQATILSQVPPASLDEEDKRKAPEALGRFGKTAFGGQFIPELLTEPFQQLEQVYKEARNDPAFVAQLQEYRSDFVGGPTPLHKAERLTELAGGATIWLKREDLCHTGAHKINNAIGQVLLSQRLPHKPQRIIAETGAGQHGVAVATICAKLGLECVVYMGAKDYERQQHNVLSMKLMGAQVKPVSDGQGTLKDAMSEAMRDAVTNIHNSYYLIGSAVGPHPIPTIVKDFQSVIGREMKQQMMEKAHKLPDAVVACVGGGSNAIGAFSAFLHDPDVRLYGVEAGGEGEDRRHCSSLQKGKPGVLQGAYTQVLQCDRGSGQTKPTHSISAGLDYPGVGPEHAYLHHEGRATYTSVTDEEALIGFQQMCQYEGIVPALETSHAIYYAVEELAKELGPGKDLVINMSGRGDKDMPQVASIMGVEL